MIESLWCLLGAVIGGGLIYPLAYYRGSRSVLVRMSWLYVNRRDKFIELVNMLNIRKE